jgi:arginine deiminase
MTTTVSLTSPWVQGCRSTYAISAPRQDGVEVLTIRKELGCARGGVHVMTRALERARAF